MGGKGMPKHMTPLERGLAILARREGRSFEYIASALHRDVYALSMFLRRKKVVQDRCNNPRKQRTLLTDYEKSQIVSAIAEGKSAYRIAADLGRPYSTVKDNISRLQKTSSTIPSTTTHTLPASNASR